MDIQHCIHKFDHKAEYTKHLNTTSNLLHIWGTATHLLPFTADNIDATIGHLSHKMGSKGVRIIDMASKYSSKTHCFDIYKSVRMYARDQAWH